MLPEFTIQFVRNYTAEPIGNALLEASHKLGLALRINYGGYDNLGVEVSSLAASGVPPRLVILTIEFDYFAGGVYSPKWEATQVRDSFNDLLNALDQLPAQTFALVSAFIPSFRATMPSVPGHPVFGKDSLILELNATLREFVAQRPARFGVLSFDKIAARLGESATIDKRFGLMMKSPFRQEFAEAVAEEILRYLRCLLLPPKKVLVLDCDNTLWGGVVGEVGVANIKLDPYDYPGVAYYRFQSEVLSIAEKGVLLCLCSKNDESAVWQVLEEHPHSLLRRDKIAAHRINWNDKASNLKELALELNLSPDAFVFVDDNPAECELVRSLFPEVTVLQVPPRIYEFPGMLSVSGLFDRLSVSKEDKERTYYYQAEQGRKTLQSRHVDTEGFLADLQMRAVVRPVQIADLSRAAQLCQRTNQFNLTTRRYTETDLAVFLNGGEVKMYILHAEDRFGALGHSGLIFFRKKGDGIFVDTFLMSCRIIGRRLDWALFCQSLKLVARDWSFTTIQADFVPTKKNSIVAGLWNDYGFTKKSVSDDVQSYVCEVSKLKITCPEMIKLVDQL